MTVVLLLDVYNELVIDVFYIFNSTVIDWTCYIFLGTHALPKRWNTCMERNGDYVEKWCHYVAYVFNKLRDKNI